MAIKTPTQAATPAPENTPAIDPGTPDTAPATKGKRGGKRGPRGPRTGPVWNVEQQEALVAVLQDPNQGNTKTPESVAQALSTHPAFTGVTVRGTNVSSKLNAIKMAAKKQGKTVKPFMNFNAKNRTVLDLFAD